MDDRSTARRTVLIAAAAAGAAALAPRAARAATATATATPRRVEVHGHRGARGLEPENTLPAFERALALGVRTLELDIVLTRDGVPVVHHDLALHPDIARDSEGRWAQPPTPPLRTLTWDELQRWDVGRLRPGTRYAQQYPAQQPRDGTRIPRLADLFALVAARSTGSDAVRYSIETKLDPRRPEASAEPAALAQALLETARAHGVLPRVQVQSFDWRTLREVQRRAPEVPTVCLTAQQPFLDNVQADQPGPSPWLAGMAWRDHRSAPKLVAAFGGRVWSSFHGDLTAAAVAEAHALGLSVSAWTVNDEAAIGRVLDLGVDAVISDRPDVALRVVRERGLTVG